MSYSYIIVGVSGGIGHYLAKKLSSEIEVKSIWGTYFNNFPNDLEINLKKLDITNFNEVENWIDSIKSELSDKIVLINSAGITYNSFAHKSDIYKWEKVINVNLVSSFNAIRLLLPLMRERKFGRIINLSSVVAQIGVIGTSAYAASKAGLWGLTKSIAKENATLGITINTINLGYFNIGMIDKVPEKIKSEILKNIPGGEFGNPKNIYYTINYIVKSDYLNGSCIDLNGGIF